MQSLTQLVPPGLHSLLTSPTINLNLNCLRPLRQLLALDRLLHPTTRRRTLPAFANIPEHQRFPSGIRLALVPPSRKNAKRYATTGNPAAAPLTAPPPDCQLSPHFRAQDLCPPASYGYRCARISIDLVEQLECIWTQLRGHSLVVLSAYRPPDYNALCGGIPNSSHVDGLGADICCEDVPLEFLYEVASDVIDEAGSVYLYPGKYVHVDVAGDPRREVY